MNDGTAPGGTATVPRPRVRTGWPPLRLVAVGLLVAFFDVRAGALDVLPDVVGWALVAVGVRRLAAGRAVPGAAAVVRLAVVAGAFGLVDQVLALVSDGARSDLVGGLLGSDAAIALGGEAFSLYGVVAALVVLTLTGVVAHLAGTVGDDATAARWTRWRWVYICSALPGLAICLMLLLGAGGAPGMVLGAVLLGVGQVVYLVVMWRSFADARRGWALR